MLDQVNKNIQRYVETGDYFVDVKEWYASKYVFPYTIRSYMLVFFICLFCNWYFLDDVSNKVSEIKRMPFPMYAYDSVNYVPVIKSLSEIKEPINISIARYMAGKYVKFRESYSYDDFDGDNRKIVDQRVQTLSSRRIFREFLDYVNPDENPDSPIVRYKNKTKLFVEVKNVELFGQYDLPEQAIVTYDLIEKSNDSESRSTRKAEMIFTMLDLEKKDDITGMPKLSFTVTSYATNKL